MPYLIETKSGDAAKKAAAEKPPFGPGFRSTVCENTHTLEVWGSSFSDQGEDYTLFKSKDQDGTVLAQQTIGGF
jgi:hypothetical protein